MNAGCCDRTYPAPLGDLGLGDVLDGHRQSVFDALPGVDGAEAALAQLGADAVGALEHLAAAGVGRQDGLQVGPRVGGEAAHGGGGGGGG